MNYSGKKIKGQFTPPGDKSVSHRIALMSLLARGRVRVKNYSPCDDCASSLNAIRKLGCDVVVGDDAVTITGAECRVASHADIDCGNSGTTIRMLMGILSGMKGEFSLDGDEYLRRRPMERIAAPLRLMGAEIETLAGKCPVKIKGRPLHGVEYELPVASAQLKSALLLAGLQASNETTVVEPVASRDHTERMLRAFGAKLRESAGRITVSHSIPELPDAFRVPGDASGASFFVCGAVITPGSEAIAQNVMLNPTRIGFIDVLKRMGANVEIVKTHEVPEPMGDIIARYTPELKAVDVTAEEIPLVIDEVPILALVATQAQGTTRFLNVGELRVKECDRLAAIEKQLGAMGANVSAAGDELVITGKTPLVSPAFELNSYGDHRIAMTLRLASLISAGETTIIDEQCASVSYPNFHETLHALMK